MGRPDCPVAVAFRGALCGVCKNFGNGDYAFLFSGLADSTRVETALFRRWKTLSSVLDANKDALKNAHDMKRAPHVSIDILVKDTGFHTKLLSIRIQGWTLYPWLDDCFGPSQISLLLVYRERQM
jgi:hypothetical protein